MTFPERMPTSNLVVYLQKLAKNVSYCGPSHRQELLLEAARRLTAYRQAERAAAPRNGWGHLEHAQQCHCLNDSVECCRPACPCHGVTRG